MVKIYENFKSNKACGVGLEEEALVSLIFTVHIWKISNVKSAETKLKILIKTHHTHTERDRATAKALLCL